MRLIEFLLNEKISKKELKDVVNNDNILIGAEFEFIHEELEEYISGNYLQQEYEDALDDYRQWEKEMNDWERELEEIRDNQIETEEKIYELREELEDVNSKIVDLSAAKRESEDEDETKRISDELEELEINKEELEEGIEELEDLFRDYESDEELHRMDGVPEPGTDYIDYVENVMNINLNMVDLMELPEPEELSERDIDENEWVEIADERLHDSIEDANFINKYDIGGYGEIHQSPSNRTWAFEYDSTVSSYGGVEMKSPPLPLPEFLDILPDILDWIDQYGKTDEHCGLHFHMSLSNVNNLAKEVDMVKLILFSEESYVYKVFPNRIDNNYAQEVKNKILRGMKSTQVKNYVSDLMGDKTIDPEQISDLAGGHYDAIHKVMDRKNPSHVEFRHPGGKGYHKKEKGIKDIIGKYATTLSIACDPDYKYREYIQKVLRLLNKIEKVSLLNKKRWLEEDLKYFDRERVPLTLSTIIKDAKIGKMAVKQYIKKLDNQINNLNVKVGEKEKRAIESRIGMSTKIKDEIKQQLSKIITKKK